MNSQGQLGDGSNASKSTPEKIPLPGGIQATAVSAGLLYTLALGADGNVYAWGNNDTGELGDGTTTSRSQPEQIAFPGGVHATAISAGDYSSLAIGSDGNLYAWGDNYFGELGDGTTSPEHVPEKITTLPAGVQPTAISAGYASGLAIGSDGNLYSWGDNSEGQLGDGTTTQQDTPEQITTLPSDVQPIAVSESKEGYGGYFGLAAGSDGKVYAWGDNAGGQLGPGQSGTSYDPVPQAVALPDGSGAAQSVSAGAEDSLALVGASAPKFAASTPPSTVTAGSQIYYQFTASGAPAPDYSLSADAPDWLTLNPSTGALSGTVPTDASSFSFSVTATNSAGSVTAGPFTVTVQAAAASVAGTVLDQGGSAVAGALVDACVAGGGACESNITGADGTFTTSAPQGSTVTFTAYPPQGDPVPPVETGTFQVPDSGLADVTITLTTPTPPPSGVSFGAGLVSEQDGVPTLNWTHSAGVTASGCANGVASISVVGRDALNGQWEYLQFPMTESPAGSGSYTATLPGLYPIHGGVEIDRSVSCPAQAGVTPQAGSTAGGTHVFLSGVGLAATTGVSFGASPGSNVTMLDDNLLEVTAPPGSGTVTVTATSASGPSVVIGQYTYVSLSPAASQRSRRPASQAARAAETAVLYPSEDVAPFGPLSATPIQDPVSPGDILARLYALAGPLIPNDISLAIDSAIGAVHPTCEAAHTVLADDVMGIVNPVIEAAAAAATPLVEAGADIAFPEAIPLTALLAPAAVNYAFSELAGSLVSAGLNAALGSCPGNQSDALIDPSGTVFDTNGNPLNAVTATILRSDTQSGPFAAVDTGSPGIAPAINPETTAADGMFHWDVSAGYYEVSASKSGCAVPGDPSQDTATIGPYPVPPPQVGLVVTLQCADEAPAPTPVVTGLSQNSGPAAGGTQLDIYGSGFTPASTVELGTTTADHVAFLSTTELQVRTPAGSGLEDVTVQTAGDTSATSPADQFYQGTAPTISAISATGGPVGGGTALAITGTGFDGALAVGFPETPGTQLTVRSDTELEITTPAATSPGTVDIQIVNAAGASAPTTADRFTYEPSSAGGSGGGGGGTSPSGGTAASGGSAGTAPSQGATPPTGSTPAVSSLRPGRARVARHTVRLSHGRQIAILLSCPRGASACAGTLALSAASRLAGRRLTLPGQTFRISGGHSHTTVIRLTGAQARLLSRVRRLRLLARLTARGLGASAAASSSVTVTLLVPH